MEKKYIVRLSDTEREQLNEIVRKFSGSSQKVRRAQGRTKGSGPMLFGTVIACEFRGLES